MKIGVSDRDLCLERATKTLLRRTLGQFSGLQQQVSFPLRGRYKPRVITCGVELTGVHILQGRPKPPGVSPYHVGGSGLTSNEALIRATGETLERYSQLIAEYAGLQELVVATFDEIAARGCRVIPLRALEMFSADQYRSSEFPFRPPRADQPLAWVGAGSLIDGLYVWVPAQLVFVGYGAKNDLGEHRIAPAVTTGSAAHTDKMQAVRNALLELIQLDSAIGHWYSNSRAYRIENDSRTAVISEIVKRYFHPFGPEVSFFWLPNADLPGFTVACIIREPGKSFPKVAIGLGSEMCLARSMYKALLEAVGVAGLSRVTLVEGCIDTENDAWKEPHVRANEIFDLDANILYFGFAEKASVVERRFMESCPVSAMDLPPDVELEPPEAVQYLIGAFKDTNKELVFLDLTTCDIRELGFVAIRVWSPDTLSLSLPSAAPLKHARLEAYGGVLANGPHPYA